MMIKSKRKSKVFLEIKVIFFISAFEYPDDDDDDNKEIKKFFLKNKSYFLSRLRIKA